LADRQQQDPEQPSAVGSNDPRLGANVVPGGTRFAVWAPKAGRVDVRIEAGGGPTDHRLAPEDDDGLFAGVVPDVGTGARYRFRLDGGEAYPDPWSRFQPEGVHGPSEVVDPSAFDWNDAAWPGLTTDGLVVYELHVGTYTPEGTFAALAGQLPELKRLGVTAIELMPVADFPGRWNWGYDGVALFAPSRAYGRPDDLRRLVDAAHREGLGVILDVVYNHLGPDGNYLGVYSDDYFTGRHATPWGDAVNYDGPNSRRVRDLVLANARSWVEEYHVDGLRLDATHAIVDDSPRHLLAALSGELRAAAPKPIVLIAEDERNDVRLVRPVAEDGFGLDAVWADDFHHELRVALTGQRDSYFSSYEGTTVGLARSIEQGFLYQGQTQPHTGKPRGTRVTAEPASAFVFCIENHDQVGNRAFGERLEHLVDPASYAVASTLLLLAPETPMLWMGQEFAASSPFLYFTDHNPELGKLVTEGRRREFAGFTAFLDPDARARIPDPQAEATFRDSKLDLSERERHAGVYRLYQDLLALRRDDPVLQTGDRGRLQAVGLGSRSIAVHRWRGDDHRLLLANLGDATDVDLRQGGFGGETSSLAWTVLLSTADRRYSGSGPEVEVEEREGAPGRVQLPERTAVLLAAIDR
jgi:maltooligosyltrehalose trehalohydrolase